MRYRRMFWLIPWMAAAFVAGAWPERGNSQVLGKPVASPESPPPPAPVAAQGLGELLRLSLEQNPGLRQAGFEVEAAQGKVTQAGLYPNPVLSVIGEEMGDRQGPGGIITAPQVNQEIVTGGKRRLSRAVALKEVDQATAAVVRQRFALFTAVRQAYFEVLVANRRFEIADEITRLAEQSFKTAAAAAEKGLFSKIDLTTFRLELQRLVADREAADRERVAAWRRLAATVGLPGLAETPLIDLLTVPVPAYDFEQVRAQVLAAHPEVQAAQAGVGRAELAVRRAEAERVPNVTVGAGYTRQNQNRSDDWMFQVSLPVPVFNRNQGNIQTARAELGKAAQEVGRVQNDLSLRLAAAFGQYESARRRAEVFAPLLKEAEANYLAIRKAVPAVFDIFRLVQAQRDFQNARLEYVRALADQWRAASEIAGLLSEEDWPGPR